MILIAVLSKAVKLIAVLSKPMTVKTILVMKLITVFYIDNTDRCFFLSYNTGICLIQSLDNERYISYEIEQSVSILLMLIAVF